MVQECSLGYKDENMFSSMYVVCSDANLLDSVNHLLTTSGILGIRDEQGKVHYLVDARHDRSKAVNTVGNMVTNGKKSFFDNSIALESAVIGLLKQHKFDMSHIGSVALKAILMTHSGDMNNNPYYLKQIVVDMSHTLGLTAIQMERDLRYAINRSDFAGIRSKLVIRMLLDELVVLERELMGNKKAVS